MLRVNDEDSSWQEPCLYLSSSSSPLLRPASPLANLQCARIFPTPTAREQFSAAHDKDCDGGPRNNGVESGTREDVGRSVRLAIQSQNKLAPRQLYCLRPYGVARTSLRPQLQHHLYHHHHHHHPLLLFIDLRAGALNELFNRAPPTRRC